MTTPTPDLPPMTPKVLAAIEHLKLESLSGGHSAPKYYAWAFAIMNAIDAIRESMEKPVADAPAPPAAAPLRVDREKVAIAIEKADGEHAIDRAGWDDYLYTKRMRQADAAIAAMGESKEYDGSYDAEIAKLKKERDATRAELAELRKAISDLVRLENQHNKKEQ